MRIIFVIASVRGFILQLTDIHTNADYPESAQRLRIFCQKEFPALAGAGLELVMVTGDMVDGTPLLFSAKRREQFPDEWLLFRESFQPCLDFAISSKIPIVSIRGNHDGFGVGNFASPSNELYRDFQDSLNPTVGNLLIKSKDGSQVFTLPGQSTTVIALDSADTSGQCRQFYARFTKNLADWLVNQLPGEEKVLVFSHYPIGAYVKADRARLLAFLESLGSRVVGYHSGHFHKFLGYPLLVRRKNDVSEFTEYEAPHFRDSGYVRVIGGSDFQAVIDLVPARSAIEDSVWPESAASRYLENVFLLTKSRSAVNGFEKSGGIWESRELRGSEISVNGLNVKVTEFSTALIYHWAFTHMQDFLLVCSFAVHSLALLFALWLYFRSKSRVFPIINLLLCLLMPMAPLAVFQATPGQYSLVFWWGAVTSDFGFMPNDISTMGVVLLQGKVMFASACLLLLTRYNYVSLRVLVGVSVFLVQLGVQKQMLIRGGLTGMFGFPLIWDLLFWSLSGLAFNLEFLRSAKSD